MAVLKVLTTRLLQLLWDRMEPAGFMHHISQDPLPNTPKHRVLMHYALGDAQVFPLTSLCTDTQSTMYEAISLRLQLLTALPAR